MNLARILSALEDDHPLPGDHARTGMVPGYRRGVLPDIDDSEWREAAVFILLYQADGGVRFPLMLRPNGTGVHAGQVSLPGGSREVGETFEACALRETSEELGVDPASVRVVRALTPLRISPSRFIVYPYVGIVETRPDYRPSVWEVAELFEPSLDELLDPAAVREEYMTREGREWLVPYYRLAGQRVWGATAMILAELVAMLRV